MIYRYRHTWVGVRPDPLGRVRPDPLGREARGRCFGRFSEEATEYDSTVNHSVCKDKEACTLRMPAGAGGRKRARPEGGYAQLARGS